MNHNPEAPRALLQRARAVQAAEAPVPSPCTSVCRMDPATGWCLGCWRTLDEIAAWGGLPEPGRRAVWARIEGRLQETA